MIKEVLLGLELYCSIIQVNKMTKTSYYVIIRIVAPDPHPITQNHSVSQGEFNLTAA